MHVKPKATELLKLAQNQSACIKGVLFLVNWMMKHPKAQAYEFFKDMMNSNISYHITVAKVNCSYFNYYDGYRKYIKGFRDENPEHAVHIVNEEVQGYLIWILCNCINWYFPGYIKHTNLRNLCLKKYNAYNAYSQIKREELCKMLIDIFNGGIKLEVEEDA